MSEQIYLKLYKTLRYNDKILYLQPSVLNSIFSLVSNSMISRKMEHREYRLRHVSSFVQICNLIYVKSSHILLNNFFTWPGQNPLKRAKVKWPRSIYCNKRLPPL